MAVGNQGYLVRNHFQHQVHETADGGVSLDVEFRTDERADFPDIGIADVPLVGSGVDGDSLGAEGLAVDGRLGDVGHISAAGVTDGGYFVDIYTQSRHIYYL